MKTDRNYCVFNFRHLQADSKPTRIARINIQAAAALALMLIMLISCSGSGSKSSGDSTADATSDWHADNDIAMTLRSVVDAVRVGEALDSTEYDFRGTLTDGTGRPLYTDIQGAPGAWEIKVVSPKCVTMRNLYLGDLLPDELRQYILQSLDIPEDALLAEGSAGNDPDAEVQIYKFDGGQLIFETKMAPTEDGEEGPLLNIAVKGS